MTFKLWWGCVAISIISLSYWMFTQINCIVNNVCNKDDVVFLIVSITIAFVGGLAQLGEEGILKEKEIKT